MKWFALFMAGLVGVIIGSGVACDAALEYSGEWEEGQGERILAGAILGLSSLLLFWVVIPGFLGALNLWGRPRRRNSQAHLNRARGYVVLRDFEQALCHLDKAIALDPESALAYSLRGAVHAELGNQPQAVADLEKALSLTEDRQQRATIEETLSELRGE